MGLPKGRTNNPAGRPVGRKDKRVRQWEALGEFMTGVGAEKAARILLSRPDDDFLVSYEKLLSYFKPKQTATQLTGETDIYIKLIHPDDELTDKI